MSGPLLIPTVLSYTPETSLSVLSSDTTRFPITNLTGRDRPLRVFRTTHNGTTTTVIKLTPPAGTTVSSIFVDNINANGQFTITSESSGQSTVDSMGTVTVAKDSFSDKYKAFFKAAVPRYFDGTTRKYIKLSFVGAGLVPETAISNLQIGAISMIASSAEITYPGGHINGIEYEKNLAVETSKFDGGGLEYTELGVSYATIAIPTRPFLESTQLQTFLSIIEAKTAPIIFYENNLNLSRAYTCKLDLSSAKKFAYTVNGQVFESSISLIECV